MKQLDKSEEQKESRKERLRSYREDMRRRYEELKKPQEYYIRSYSTAIESTFVEKWLRFVCATWPSLIKIGMGMVLPVFQSTSELLGAVFSDGLSVLARVRLTSPTARKLVKNPPGHRLLKLAEILFSRKTVVLTFKPLIADWQFEYFDGLTKKFPSWRLRLISFRYYWYFIKACGLSKVAGLFRSIARSRL